MNSVDVAVRGQGVVGMSLALGLARQGLSVGLLGPAAAPSAPAEDVRTYALGAGSVALLSQLKVWDALPEGARTPVYDMRIAGDAPGSVLEFSAWRSAVEALAWIVDAAELERVLREAVRYAPHIAVLGDVEVQAPLTALAEGKASASRERLGVAMPVQAYGQHAVAARLVSQHGHQGMARQWFGSPDILALLPFDRPEPERSYGLVWSVSPERAAELLAMDVPAFEAALAAATPGADLQLSLAGQRQAWPLSLARAEQVCGPGWVLLGDAAHVVHPLAGQGLNLGLADVACLTKVLHAREPWRALGDEKLLRRYARERLGPTVAMGQLTDGLWHLFAHPHPVARELRNRGLSLLNQLSPLKRALAQRAFHA